MPDDPKLTRVERLTLINQFQILETIASNPDDAKSYALKQEVLREGYEILYESEAFIGIENSMSSEDCREVWNTMDMFDAIGLSLPQGSPLKNHRHSRFSGYDGNNEPDFMAFAKFTFERLERFQNMPKKVADPWNSHCRMRGVYGRMLSEWQKVPDADRFSMSRDQVKAILDAARHPDAD